jgi:protocatechuate 3,4-dioxygenase beta subunit
LLLCCGLSVFAQDAQPTLAGKVLNSATGEPVRKALVKLMSMGAQSKGGSAVTDAAGRFEFTALAPGTYALAASRDGFDSATARGGLKLQRVTLAAGEQKNDIVIRLTPFGVVTGRIIDDDGDPVRQIQVQTMVYRYTATGRQLAQHGQATTNDLGEYRIYDLPAGRYYLKAASPESMGGEPAGTSYGASYYPGTADAAAAAPIEIAAGQTLDGIDLTLRATRIATIRGRVTNPGGVLTVGLFKVTDDGGASATHTSADDHGGKFELKGVSPGSYLVTAGSTIGGQHYSGSLPIQVGTADLEGVELRLLPPMEIAGQIRIEGKTNAKLSQVRVVLESGGRNEESMAGGGGAKDDGSFVLPGLEPAVYQITVQAPEDLYLKAVRWSDRDVMQSGLDLTQGAAESRLVVVMSAAGGQIDGVVEDEQSAPAAVALVTVVPSSGGPSVKSLFKYSMTNPAGHFHMQGIAPGSYKLFAWEDADPNQVMFDPDFLKPFDSAGKSIEISEGSKEAVQLTLIKQAAEKQTPQ